MNHSFVVLQVTALDQQPVAVAIEVSFGPNLDLEVFDLDLATSSAHGPQLVPSASKNGQFFNARIKALAKVDQLSQVVQICGEVIEEEQSLLPLNVNLDLLKVHLSHIVGSFRDLVEHLRQGEAMENLRESINLKQAWVQFGVEQHLHELEFLVTAPNLEDRLENGPAVECRVVVANADVVCIEHLEELRLDKLVSLV